MKVEIDFPRFKYDIGFIITDKDSKLKLRVKDIIVDYTINKDGLVINSKETEYLLEILQDDLEGKPLNHMDKFFLAKFGKAYHVEDVPIYNKYVDKIIDIIKSNIIIIDEISLCELLGGYIVDSLDIPEFCDNFNYKTECSPLYNEWMEYKEVCSNHKRLCEYQRKPFGEIKFNNKVVDRYNIQYFIDNLKKRKDELYNILHADKTI